jgi:hypothetical protein
VRSAVLALPDRLVLLFAAAVLSVGPLVAFGQFRVWLVLPLFLIVAGLTWRLAPEAVRPTRPAVLGTVAAVAIAVAWVLLNAGYVSEYFVVVRDPAVYTLRAIWLTHHPSPNLANPHALQGARGVADAYTDTSGFFQAGPKWEPQGSSLVPALLAVGGWVAGVTGVLTANLVIGALGLLALYAVGRRLLGPIWALAPVLALATSMPMVAFSRAPYTEPTAMILALAGLGLLASTLTPRSAGPPRAPAIGQAVLAGLVIGATFLVRPDGLLAVLGASLGLGVLTVFARAADRRQRLRIIVVAFHAGAAVSVVLTFIDLGHNSVVYEATSWTQLKPLTIAVGLASALVIGICLAPSPRRLRDLLARREHPLAAVAAGLVLLGFTVLAVRPLVYTVHASTHTLAAAAIKVRQAALNLPVDGSRTYDENTVTWLSWYYSWPLVILGAIGAAGLTYGVARRRATAAVPLLGVLGVSSALYLNRSEITPDQIWAMRRYLPVVVPLGLLLAAGVLRTAWCQLHDRPGAAGSSQRRWVRSAQGGLAVAGLALALAPALSWGQTFTVAQYGGDRALLSRLCATVAGSDVIIADRGPGGTIFLPGLRVQCGVQAVLAADPTPAALAQIAANWRHGGSEQPVVVLSFLADAAPWTRPPTGPVVRGSATVWDEPLLHRATTWHTDQAAVYVGDLQPSGLVAPRGAPN